MTTMPTPAILAARAPAVRRRSIIPPTDEMLAPARLPRTARFQPEHGRAVRESGMTPSCRLVALTLAAFGHYRTGHIATERQPRLRGLADATGLSTGQVRVALRALETRGWVTCTGSRDYDEATLRPRIPQHAIASLTTA